MSIYLKTKVGKDGKVKKTEICMTGLGPCEQNLTKKDIEKLKKLAKKIASGHKFEPITIDSFKKAK